MKKSVILAVGVFAMCFMLSACGDQQDKNTQESAAPSQQQTVEMSQSPSTEEPENNDISADGFQQFKEGLGGAGYTYETVTMAADLIGAERGEKYKFDFGKVELYRFADGAEPLATGEVVLDGFGALPIYVNGNYGAIIDVTENEDAIKEIFNSLK